ncbi:hypothetical protein ABTE87_19840, partial [Acinetobacter baumannii]
RDAQHVRGLSTRLGMQEVAQATMAGVLTAEGCAKGDILLQPGRRSQPGPASCAGATASMARTAKQVA